MVKTFCTLITLTFLVALLETNVNSFFLGARGFSASAAGRCRFVLGTTKGDGDDINDSAQQQQQHFERRRVVIVGGGVGGMAIASRIASSLPDIKISILEKNEKIGGRCGSFDVEVPGVRGGTFRHERGPSLLLLPDIYRELFEECCASSRDLNSAEAFGLNIMPCVPAYQVVFDDGDRIEVGFPRNRENSTLTDAETKSRSAMDSFEVNGSGKWDEYMKACEAFLDCGLPNFIEERIDVTTLPAFLREALRDSCKAWPLKSHSEVLDAIFSSNKMKALASFQDLYVGLEPYRNDQKFGGGVLQSTAPAVFGLLAAIELHPTNKKCGVFAPEGGFRQVSNSFEKLVRHLGVEVSCGRMVTSITDAGVYHCAADDDGGSSTTLFEPADLVVVNADLPYATKSLFSNSFSQQIPRYDWDDGFRYSSGVIAFHWSTSKCLSDLNTHNVFMTTRSRSDAEESWSVVRETQDIPLFSTVDEPFNFYVHRASKTDPTAAPEVSHSFIVNVQKLGFYSLFLCVCV